MTREQVYKHKQVIAWWLENTGLGVLTKDAQGGWYVEKDPQFAIGAEYIQNDIYAELRIAQADGKVIQWAAFEEGNTVWQDETPPTIFHLPPDRYQIKPEPMNLKQDIFHLNWIYDKLIHEHGHSADYAFMRRFKTIIAKLECLESTSGGIQDD